MLGIFSRVATSLWKFSTIIPKKQPPHLALLSLKLKQQLKGTPKKQILFQSLNENQIEKYFQSKNIQDFSLQEMYFYLTHQELFQKPNSDVHFAIINNKQLDVFSSFLIAFHTQASMDNECQKSLVNLFNLKCKSLKPEQLIYCLKMINDFKKNELIDCSKLKNTLQQIEQQQFNRSYLQLLYYLKQIKSLDQFVNIEQAKRYVQQLSEQIIIKKDTHIKYFYFIHTLEQYLKIPLSQQILNIRQNQIQQKMKQAKIEEQLQYCVKILLYYNQFTYFINTERLSPKLYITYLQFLYQQKKQNPNFLVTRSQIQNKLFISATKKQFLRILQLHFLLQIDNYIQLQIICKNIINNNKFDCLTTFVQYLNDQQIYELEIWKNLEKSFVNKLRLNSKYRNLYQISRDYDMLKILQFFVYIEENKLGSVFFWKHIHRFLYDFLMEQKLIQHIAPENLNKFIISCYQVFGIRTYSPHLAEKLKKICLKSLCTHKWQIDQLYSLTKCLTNTKNGDFELWSGIQVKLLTIKVTIHSEENLKKKMSLIFSYFKQMKRGKYDYMQAMNILIKNNILTKYEINNKINELI